MLHAQYLVSLVLGHFVGPGVVVLGEVRYTGVANECSLPYGELDLAVDACAGVRGLLRGNGDGKEGVGGRVGGSTLPR